MSVWSDLLGTTQSFFRIGLTGVRLKNNAGALAVRNAADSADAAVTASAVNVSGNSIVINSDAAATGADWQITLSRPSTGMTANYTLTLPVDDGSPSQILSTDGSGNLSWTSVAGTTDKETVDTTSLAFGTTSPLALFTLPANALITKILVVIDTAFNGTPTLSVGISGTASKYLSSTSVDLTASATTVFESNPGITPTGSTEALIATYSGGGATAGAARIVIHYAIPA